MTIIFTLKTIQALSQCSGDVACDMCSGGNDPELVAEATISVLECFNKAAYREISDLCDAHGYDAVLDEAARHVGTL